MKKARKLGLQSLALVLMAFVLVAGVAFGMTGAWFSDKTDEVSEQITLATGVDIEIAKKSGNANYLTVSGTNEENGDPVVRDQGKVFPGDTISFDAVVTNVKEAAYIRFKMEATGALATYFAPDTTHFAETGKILLAAGTGSQDIHAAGSLTGNALTNANAGETLTVKVTVYAIQAANYAEGNWAQVAEFTGVFGA